MFEQPSKIIIGLERYILQTIGFDFRGRYPQKLLSKLVRRVIPAEGARDFVAIAYPMSVDIYKTFSPIKQSTFTVVLSIMELTVLLTEKYAEEVQSLDLGSFHTNRDCVMETTLDLLDLYTQFHKTTKVGLRFDLAKFIGIKIKLNQEVGDGPTLSRFHGWCEKCEVEDREVNPITPGSATSPATTGSWPGSNAAKRNQKGQEGTMRFVFDAEQAQKESDRVAEYFREEYEDFEMEVEEEIPVYNHNNHSHHNHTLRRDRGYNHHDTGWSPYHRNRSHRDGPRGRRDGYY